MIIDSPTAGRFIAAYMDFLGSLVSNQEKQKANTTEWLNIGRSRFAAERGLLDTYRRAHRRADAEMLDAIAALRIGRWIYLRDTAHYSVLLADDHRCAYGVLGLTDRLRDITQGESGILFHAGLMPLNGRWVCDALLANSVWLGPNMRRDLAATYQTLRKTGRFSLGPARDESIQRVFM